MFPGRFREWEQTLTSYHCQKKKKKRKKENPTIAKSRTQGSKIIFWEGDSNWNEWALWIFIAQHFAITYLKKNITGLLIGCDMCLHRRVRAEKAEMEGVAGSEDCFSWDVGIATGWTEPVWQVKGWLCRWAGGWVKREIEIQIKGTTEGRGFVETSVQS